MCNSQPAVSSAGCMMVPPPVPAAPLCSFIAPPTMTSSSNVNGMYILVNGSGPSTNVSNNNTNNNQATAAVISSSKSSNNNNSNKSSTTNNGERRHLITTHNYRNHSNEMPPEGFDEVAFFKQQNNGGGNGNTNSNVPTAFPIKLYEMLARVDEDGISDIVSWQPHGRAFLIHKPKEFRELLTKYFTLTKIASFQRQLNLYGFKRLSRGKDRGCYYHELFLKGKPFLMQKMHRVKIKGTGIRARSNPDQEPDFWKMSWVGCADGGCGNEGSDASNDSNDENAAPAASSDDQMPTTVSNSASVEYAKKVEPATAAPTASSTTATTASFSSTPNTFSRPVRVVSISIPSNSSTSSLVSYDSNEFHPTPAPAGPAAAAAPSVSSTCVHHIPARSSCDSKTYTSIPPAVTAAPSTTVATTINQCSSINCENNASTSTTIPQYQAQVQPSNDMMIEEEEHDIVLMSWGKTFYYLGSLQVGQIEKEMKTGLTLPPPPPKVSKNVTVSCPPILLPPPPPSNTVSNDYQSPVALAAAIASVDTSMMCAEVPIAPVPASPRLPASSSLPHPNPVQSFSPSLPPAAEQPSTSTTASSSSLPPFPSLPSFPQLFLSESTSTTTASAEPVKVLDDDFMTGVDLTSAFDDLIGYKGFTA